MAVKAKLATGWGMPLGKKPSKMMDKGRKVMKTKAGPDDNNSTKMAENMTAPNMPQRDGPARDTVDGGVPSKPPTSAKAQKVVMPTTGKKMMPTIGGAKPATSAPASMPPANVIASMKKSIGGMGRF